MKHLGAFHSSEIAYVFGHPEYLSPIRGVPPQDQQLSDAMLTAWVRFAATGDPNGSDLPAWPRYDAEQDACLEFGDVIRVRRHLFREACDIADIAHARKVDEQAHMTHEP